MIENAITFDNTDNSTELVLYLSDTVQVLKEEMAFPFGSLVADCGGILGLFVGFNFLMLWDLVLCLLDRISFHSRNLYSSDFIK